MIRRRRRSQEIGFSFDSFLDVVANVVGIIIRLILVVWVGARSYGTLHPLPQPAAGAGRGDAARRPAERPPPGRAGAAAAGAGRAAGTAAGAAPARAAGAA